MWEEEKVVLDQRTFKALAAETRVSILKTLNTRRHTQTELSATLGMSVPTVKEHLDAMEKAGLVKMADEGRKWKYYELTETARCIMEPDRKRLWITLGITGIAVLAGAAGIGRQLMSPLLAPKQFEVAANQTVAQAAQTPPLTQAMQWQPGLGFYVYLGIIVVLFLLCAYFYVRARKQRRMLERFLK